MVQVLSLEDRRGFKDYIQERDRFSDSEEFLRKMHRIAPKIQLREDLAEMLSEEGFEGVRQRRLQNAKLTLKENWRRWGDTIEEWRYLDTLPQEDTKTIKRREKARVQLKRSADKCLYYAAMVIVLEGAISKEIEGDNTDGEQ